MITNEQKPRKGNGVNWMDCIHKDIHNAIFDVAEKIHIKEPEMHISTFFYEFQRELAQKIYEAAPSPSVAEEMMKEAINEAKQLILQVKEEQEENE